MPKSPPITAPNFGRWLQLQRGDRSLEQIAIKVRPCVRAAGLKVNASLIHKIEKGRVPSWPLIFAFASVYKIPIQDLVAQLIPAIEFPGVNDLIRQGAGVKVADEPASQGGASAYDQTSAREFAEQIARITNAFASSISEVSREYLAGLADAPTPAPVDTSDADRIRSRRKAG